MRLQAAVDEYLAAQRGRHAPSTTIKAYASDLRRFMNAAPAELSRIDAEIVRVFLEHESTLTSATRRGRHASLSAFFRWLVQRELVDFNPVDRVAPARTVVRLPRPLDNQQCGRSWRRSRPAPAVTGRSSPSFTRPACES